MYYDELHILLAIASFPVFALLGYIYAKDNQEKEPLQLLATLVLYGAIATIPAIIGELLLGNLLTSIYYESTMSDMTFLLLENFIGIALVEEFLKYRAMMRKTWESLEFNSLFDGIVYAVYVSLGFALAENIMYVLNYGFEIGVMRAFTAIPGHCCFAILMGAFYGYAKKADFDNEPSHAFHLRMIGLTVAVIAHGMYDFLATTEDTYSWIVFTISMFIICFVVAKHTAKKDHYIDR